MRDFKCSKCPETMSSKCPYERSIFCSNQYITLLSNSIVKKAIPYSKGSQAQCLQLEYGCYGKETTPEQMFSALVRELRALTPEQAEILICDHEWYLEEGEVCSLSGHEHNRREEEAPVMSEEELDAKWQEDKP